MNIMTSFKERVGMASMGIKIEDYVKVNNSKDALEEIKKGNDVWLDEREVRISGSRGE